MKRLRYISTFAKPMDREAIDSLAREAQRHNERVGITGILVVTGDLFFQIIEGSEVEIDRLFERIKKDARHTRVLVLSVEQGDLTRMCPDWAMRKVDLSRDTAERATPVRAMLHIAYVQRQLLDETVEALETFTWRGFIDAEVEALSAET